MLRNEMLISTILALALTVSACATAPVPIAGRAEPAPRSDAAEAVHVVAGLACTGGVAFLGVLLVNPAAAAAVPMCW